MKTKPNKKIWKVIMPLVVRLTEEANAVLVNLKHKAFVEQKKIVFKNRILEWLVVNTPKSNGFDEAFTKWIKDQ